MSTHTIDLYEEISKIITKLSSNIIKYAPYFFCWLTTSQTPGTDPGIRCHSIEVNHPKCILSSMNAY